MRGQKSEVRLGAEAARQRQEREVRRSEVRNQRSEVRTRCRKPETRKRLRCFARRTRRTPRVRGKAEILTF